VDGGDGYSGFSVRDPQSGDRWETVLGDRLTAAGVHTVVLVGLAGDYCVRDTALDARRLGLDVVVPLGLTRFVNVTPGDDERAISTMRRAGAHVE
jgi:nicotinamidase/pyrazinamidase